MFASLVGVKWLRLDLLNNKVEYLCLCYLILNFLFCEVPAQDFCPFLIRLFLLYVFFNFIFFNLFFFISWRLITLQYCSGFRHTCFDLEERLFSIEARGCGTYGSGR